MAETPTAVSMRLAELSVPQVTITASSLTTDEEINDLAANADHRRRMEVQRVAISNDSAGVAEAIRLLERIGNTEKNVDCRPHAKLALSALEGTGGADATQARITNHGESSYDLGTAPGFKHKGGHFGPKG